MKLPRTFLLAMRFATRDVEKTRRIMTRGGVKVPIPPTPPAKPLPMADTLRILQIGKKAWRQEKEQ